MTRLNSSARNFLIFGVVMALLTGVLFMTFSQYRSGSTNGYSAVFVDASRIKTGDTVRVAGIRVGTVQNVKLRADNTVEVSFGVDPKVMVTAGTKVAVRYLNLVGDRYLALVDGPGSPQRLPVGSQIPADRTVPALDLDLLLGGLKPVVQGLNPTDVNSLTAALLRVLQGQGGALQSLLSESSSFTDSLADNSQVVQELIDNLRTTLVTLAKDGEKVSASVDKLDRLVSVLSRDRESTGAAIDALDRGTASLADLLTDARPPLAETVNQLNRVAPLLDQDKDRLDAALQRAPGNYRKLARMGSYGSFVQFYLCGLSVRVTDLQGRTAEFPWIKQDLGRCSDS
ncbi:MCE family protein [Mycobacterium sp. CVI_P3]|uniref:MCE family protein n=1 Tax=Mycobacterium pinniadriaticum TaxID=2994102 RepID=A0ABT3SQ72_9MYCO|nr:MCE family protein [Mycobacterium pinniadriaticum]MCX2934549.1 MCE family protein [Mycobacterium pinniadriaticum]MCX2940972.1 MCE family protein [Mycobacterium pinniadriaticum]